VARGCTAACGRARYTVGPMGKVIAEPRSSECRGGGARQQARADRLGRAATRTTNEAHELGSAMRLYASHLLSGRPCPVSSGAISRGGRPRRRDGLHPALLLAAETRELCRAQSTAAPIMSWSGAAWPHQQARSQPCARHADRGSLGCRQGARPAAFVLPAYPCPPWLPGRSGRRGIPPRNLRSRTQMRIASHGNTP
jgi:hypothetical protein